jgi:hypothetical protein
MPAPSGSGNPPEQEGDSSFPGGTPAERLRDFLKARLPQNSDEKKKPEDLNPEKLREEEKLKEEQEKPSGEAPHQD